MPELILAPMPNRVPRYTDTGPGAQNGVQHLHVSTVGQGTKAGLGSYHHRLGCQRVEQNRMRYGISWCITGLSQGLIKAMSTEYVQDGLKHDAQK